MTVLQRFQFNLVQIIQVFIINYFVAPYEEKSCKHHLRKV